MLGPEYAKYALVRNPVVAFPSLLTDVMQDLVYQLKDDGEIPGLRVARSKAVQFILSLNKIEYACKNAQPDSDLSVNRHATLSTLTDNLIRRFDEPVSMEISSVVVAPELRKNGSKAVVKAALSTIGTEETGQLAAANALSYASGLTDIFPNESSINLMFADNDILDNVSAQSRIIDRTLSELGHITTLPYTEVRRR